MSPRLAFRSIALFALGATLASPTTAQVPPGDAIVGTYFDQSVPNVSGSPGLYIVSLPGGQVTPITGLPKELTAKGQFSNGVWDVKLRSSDGAVLVCPIGVGPMYLHVFYLNGATVDQTRSKKVFLGVATKGIAALNLTVMPDDRIYVGAGQQDQTGAIHFLDNGPMSTSSNAIVDDSLSPATVTPVLGLPTAPAPGKVASDRIFFPTERYYYLLLNDYVWYHPQSSSSLYRYDLQNKTSCLLASWPKAAAVGMVMDDDGTLYVSTTVIATAENTIHTITPDGCNKPQSTSVRTSELIAPVGMAMDRRSGRLVLSLIDKGPTAPSLYDNVLVYADPVTGKLTKITSGPMGGWSRTSFGGLAINNTIESYGPLSDGANRYYFENFPNPSGQPTVGDMFFSLTLRATGTPQASVLLISPDRDDLNIQGLRVLTNLGTSIVKPIKPGMRTSVHLPIPNNPALKGLVWNVQSVHDEGNRLAASRGLTLVIQ